MRGIELFKYQPVNNEGQPTGFLSKKGSVGKKSLQLNDCKIEYENISEVTSRDKKIIITLESSKGLSKAVKKGLHEGRFLILAISKMTTTALEKKLNSLSSGARIIKLKEQLASEGRIHEFKSINCPCCKSEVNLTGFDSSRYVYCNFCESIFSEHGKQITDGHVHKSCEECGMFDEIKSYTEFYFYFLLVIYGYSYQKRYVCKTCANGIFWKTFFANVIFILGIIPSLSVKLKLMRNKEPKLKSLSKAVKMSLKGNYQAAKMHYQDIYRSLPEHPGVLFNESLGHMIGGDSQGAMDKIDKSLTSCSNYMPALMFLNNLQQEQA
jgi:hypothetical protein